MNKSVSGITKRNKRSIQEIDRERNRHSNDGSANNGGDGSGSNATGGHDSHQQPPRDRGSQKAATFGLWFVGVIGIVFLFFLFSVIFAETTMTVYPKTASIDIDDSFTASNDTDVDGVPFSTVSVDESVEMSATSTGSEYREEAASGEITIYNEFSQEPIRLVANTRFQSPDGLIYRTQEPIQVPGQDGDGSPGTVTATVFADEAGADYNINASDFSIPGFAGTEYEEAVYADTQGISGGIAREVPIVASSTRAEIEEEASSQLRGDLTTDLQNELPEGFISYEDGRFFNVEISGSENTSTSSTAITVTGELQAVTFDGKRLSSFLATAYSDDVDENADIRIQDLDEFDFSIIDRDSFNPESDQSFEFSLAGESKIVWQYDDRALVRDMRGLQKSQLEEVLTNYDGVQEAEIVTRPFWKQTLPSEASEIDVETVIR